jgi:hypothetical protein
MPHKKSIVAEAHNRGGVGEKILHRELSARRQLVRRTL